MDLDFEKKYHEVEQGHFWFKARRAFIIQLLSKAPTNLSVLDVGCSSGLLLEDLMTIGFEKESLYGIDISEKAIGNCKSKGLKNTSVMDAQHLDFDRKFDIIIASDCLEHLQEDKKALENWYKFLNPGGKLYVFVPAFMMLWSEHDVVNNHHKRYTRKELKTLLSESGFVIEKSSYWNFLLFLPILILRLFSRLLPSKQNKSGDLERIPVANSFLYHIINFENKLLKHLNFPFGVSTFCIAKKK